MEEIAIYGGGSWGTALATHIANIKKKAVVFVRNQQLADSFNINRLNEKYLPEIRIQSGIRATTDLNEIKNFDLIIVVVPSYALVDTINIFKSLKIPASTDLLLATKGVTSEPVQLFSTKIEAVIPNNFAFLSGPNLAKEVAQYKPTAATIAAKDISLAKKLAQILTSPKFEISCTDDIVTIQVAGLVKNIIAIKSGILTASNAGENAKAWLITNGLRETQIIATELGGRDSTLIEPGVIGDLILTCYSNMSRNTKFGYELHKNNYYRQFINNYPLLIEGLEGARAITKLVNINSLSIPIISSVVKCLGGEL